MAVLALLVAAAAASAVPADWLVAPASSLGHASLSTGAGGRGLVLGNHLIERAFTVEPDFACTSFRSLMASPPSEILRSVQPEALVQLDGIDYHVGGLVLPTAGGSNCSADACPDAARRGVFTDAATLATMVRNESAFNYLRHSSGQPKPRFEWTPGTRHAPSDVFGWAPEIIWGQKMGSEGSRLAESERGCLVLVEKAQYLYTPL